MRFEVSEPRKRIFIEFKLNILPASSFFPGFLMKPLISILETRNSSEVKYKKTES